MNRGMPIEPISSKMNYAYETTVQPLVYGHSMWFNYNYKILQEGNTMNSSNHNIQNLVPVQQLQDVTRQQQTQYQQSIYPPGTTPPYVQEQQFFPTDTARYRYRRPNFKAAKTRIDRSRWTTRTSLSDVYQMYHDDSDHEFDYPQECFGPYTNFGRGRNRHFNSPHTFQRPYNTKNTFSQRSKFVPPQYSNYKKNSSSKPDANSIPKPATIVKSSSSCSSGSTNKSAATINIQCNKETTNVKTNKTTSSDKSESVKVNTSKTDQCNKCKQCQSVVKTAKSDKCDNCRQYPSVVKSVETDHWNSNNKTAITNTKSDISGNFSENNSDISNKKVYSNVFNVKLNKYSQWNLPSPEKTLVKIPKLTEQCSSKSSSKLDKNSETNKKQNSILEEPKTVTKISSPERTLAKIPKLTEKCSKSSFSKSDKNSETTINQNSNLEAPETVIPEGKLDKTPILIEPCSISSSESDENNQSSILKEPDKVTKISSPERTLAIISKLIEPCSESSSKSDENSKTTTKQDSFIKESETVTKISSTQTTQVRTLEIIEPCNISSYSNSDKNSETTKNQNCILKESESATKIYYTEGTLSTIPKLIETCSQGSSIKSDENSETTKNLISILTEPEAVSKISSPEIIPARIPELIEYTSFFQSGENSETNKSQNNNLKESETITKPLSTPDSNNLISKSVEKIDTNLSMLQSENNQKDINNDVETNNNNVSVVEATNLVSAVIDLTLENDEFQSIDDTSSIDKTPEVLSAIKLEIYTIDLTHDLTVGSNHIISCEDDNCDKSDSLKIESQLDESEDPSNENLGEQISTADELLDEDNVLKDCSNPTQDPELSTEISHSSREDYLLKKEAEIDSDQETIKFEDGHSEPEDSQKLAQSYGYTSVEFCDNELCSESSVQSVQVVTTGPKTVDEIVTLNIGNGMDNVQLTIIEPDMGDEDFLDEFEDFILNNNDSKKRKSTDSEEDDNTETKRVCLETTLPEAELKDCSISLAKVVPTSMKSDSNSLNEKIKRNKRPIRRIYDSEEENDLEIEYSKVKDKYNNNENLIKKVKKSKSSNTTSEVSDVKSNTSKLNSLTSNSKSAKKSDSNKNKISKVPKLNNEKHNLNSSKIEVKRADVQDKEVTSDTKPAAIHKKMNRSHSVEQSNSDKKKNDPNYDKKQKLNVKIPKDSIEFSKLKNKSLNSITEQKIASPPKKLKHSTSVPISIDITSTIESNNNIKAFLNSKRTTDNKSESKLIKEKQAITNKTPKSNNANVVSNKALSSLQKSTLKHRHSVCTDRVEKYVSTNETQKIKITTANKTEPNKIDNSLNNNRPKRRHSIGLDNIETANETQKLARNTGNTVEPAKVCQSLSRGRPKRRHSICSDKIEKFITTNETQKVKRNSANKDVIPAKIHHSVNNGRPKRRHSVCSDEVERYMTGKPDTSRRGRPKRQNSVFAEKVNRTPNSTDDENIYSSPKISRPARPHSVCADKVQTRSTVRKLRERSKSVGMFVLDFPQRLTRSKSQEMGLCSDLPRTITDNIGKSRDLMNLSFDNNRTYSKNPRFIGFGECENDRPNSNDPRLKKDLHNKEKQHINNSMNEDLLNKDKNDSFNHQNLSIPLSNKDLHNGEKDPRLNKDLYKKQSTHTKQKQDNNSDNFENTRPNKEKPNVTSDKILELFGSRLEDVNSNNKDSFDLDTLDEFESDDETSVHCKVIIHDIKKNKNVVETTAVIDDNKKSSNKEVCQNAETSSSKLLDTQQHNLNSETHIPKEKDCPNNSTENIINNLTILNNFIDDKINAHECPNETMTEEQKVDLLLSQLNDFINKTTTKLNDSKITPTKVEIKKKDTNLNSDIIPITKCKEPPPKILSNDQLISYNLSAMNYNNSNDQTIGKKTQTNIDLTESNNQAKDNDSNTLKIHDNTLLQKSTSEKDKNNAVKSINKENDKTTKPNLSSNTSDNSLFDQVLIHYSGQLINTINVAQPQVNNLAPSTCVPKSIQNLPEKPINSQKISQLENFSTIVQNNSTINTVMPDSSEKVATTNTAVLSSSSLSFQPVHQLENLSRNVHNSTNNDGKELFMNAAGLSPPISLQHNSANIQPQNLLRKILPKPQNLLDKEITKNTEIMQQQSLPLNTLTTNTTVPTASQSMQHGSANIQQQNLPQSTLINSQLVTNTTVPPTLKSLQQGCTNIQQQNSSQPSVLNSQSVTDTTVPPTLKSLQHGSAYIQQHNLPPPTSLNLNSQQILSQLENLPKHLQSSGSISLVSALTFSNNISQLVYDFLILLGNWSKTMSYFYTLLNNIEGIDKTYEREFFRHCFAERRRQCTERADAYLRTVKLNTCDIWKAIEKISISIKRTKNCKFNAAHVCYVLSYFLQHSPSLDKNPFLTVFYNTISDVNLSKNNSDKVNQVQQQTNQASTVKNNSNGTEQISTIQTTNVNTTKDNNNTAKIKRAASADQQSNSTVTTHQLRRLSADQQMSSRSSSVESNPNSRPNSTEQHAALQTNTVNKPSSSHIVHHQPPLEQSFIQPMQRLPSKNVQQPHNKNNSFDPTKINSLYLSEKERKTLEQQVFAYCTISERQNFLLFANQQKKSISMSQLLRQVRPLRGTASNVSMVNSLQNVNKNVSSTNVTQKQMLAPSNIQNIQNPSVGFNSFTQIPLNNRLDGHQQRPVIPSNHNLSLNDSARNQTPQHPQPKLNLSSMNASHGIQRLQNHPLNVQQQKQSTIQQSPQYLMHSQILQDKINSLSVQQLKQSTIQQSPQNLMNSQIIPDKINPVQQHKQSTIQQNKQNLKNSHLMQDNINVQQQIQSTSQQNPQNLKLSQKMQFNINALASKSPPSYLQHMLNNSTPQRNVNTTVQQENLLLNYLLYDKTNTPPNGVSTNSVLDSMNPHAMLQNNAGIYKIPPQNNQNTNSQLQSTNNINSEKQISQQTSNILNTPINSTPRSDPESRQTSPVLHRSRNIFENETPNNNFKIRLPLSQPRNAPEKSQSPTTSDAANICNDNDIIRTSNLQLVTGNTDEFINTDFSPSNTVIRNISKNFGNSTVSAPTVESSVSMKHEQVSVEREQTTNINESGTCVNNNESNVKIESDWDVIDLTILNDVDNDCLKQEIIAKMEAVDENEIIEIYDDNPEPDDHPEPDTVNNAPSPTDSGICSPSCNSNLQNEYMEAIYLNRFCICGKEAVYVCSCDTVIYCGSECQKQHWSIHKPIHDKKKPSK